MSESNVDLKGLQQQVAEKKRLEAKLQELYTQQEMLEAQTQTLRLSSTTWWESWTRSWIRSGRRPMRPR